MRHRAQPRLARLRRARLRSPSAGGRRYAARRRGSPRRRRGLRRRGQPSLQRRAVARGGRRLCDRLARGVPAVGAPRAPRWIDRHPPQWKAAAGVGLALHEFDAPKAYATSVLAGFTGRRGGVSKPPYDELNLGLHVGDDPDAVLENRRRLASALWAWSPPAFVFAQQVHGKGCGWWTTADRGPRRAALRGCSAGHRCADHGRAGSGSHDNARRLCPCGHFRPSHSRARSSCTPVGEAPVHHVVLQCHRGNACANSASDPGTLVAGIGPSIGPASYVAGPEVAQRALSSSRRPISSLRTPRASISARPLGRRRR